MAVALNHGQIESHPERISNTKPFIDQYDWREINSPSHTNDRIRFEKSNKSIPLNTLNVSYSTKEIKYAHKSKH